MEKEKAKNTSARSNDWANDSRIRKSFPKLAEALTEDRRKSLERIESLGLPTAELIKTDLTSFLNDPENFFSQLPSGKYYVALNPLDPKNEKLRRCGKADLTRSQVIEYINDHVPPGVCDQFEIKLEEYANKYGGTIVIGGKNEIWIEFKDDKQSEIGSGTAIAKYIAKQDGHTGTMRYNFEDEELRKAIYNMLQYIPHKGERRDKEYLPGYYEFALFEKKEGLRPIFFDYRDNPEFQLNWKLLSDNFPDKRFESFSGTVHKDKTDQRRADAEFMLGQILNRNKDTYFKLLDLDLEQLEGKKILDVGSGKSEFSAEMKKWGINVTSVDMLYRLKAGRDLYHSGNAPTQNGPNLAIGALAESLPLKDNDYDLAIYLFSSFHYPTNKQNLSDMLKEALRVIKIGGKIVIFPAFFSSRNEDPQLEFDKEVKGQKELQKYFQDLINEKRRNGTLKMTPKISIYSAEMGDYDNCYLEIEKIK